MKGTRFGCILASFVLLRSSGQTATGTIQDVQHVVILMQENRSFDHYFGSLAGVRGFKDRNALLQQNGLPIFYQSAGTNFVVPFIITNQCLNDVEHYWDDEHLAWRSGWWDQWIPVQGAASMETYTRQQLPFYYALADAYTICDEYHCSVLGPTYPNRLCLMTGTIDAAGVGGGPATNNQVPTNGFSWTTYPERLQAAGITWRVYEQSNNNFGLNALRWFTQFRTAVPGEPLYDRGLQMVGDVVQAFQFDVTNGTLPQVSWIIPPWTLSEHPPFPPNNGALFTKQLLDALASAPTVYASTVFILTYDESGGFFDHVPPPVPPPGTPDEFVGYWPIGLGARVPLLIVSPWSRGGYVCSQVFDHTSIIRFLETWTGVAEPNISSWRRQVCGDLTSAFDFTSLDPNYVSSAAWTSVSCSPVTPALPAVQSLPPQEPGLRPARHRVYHSDVSLVADCANGQIGITMTNGGSVSTHFMIYPNSGRTDGPWQDDLIPGEIRTDWFLVGADGSYDFTCYGPHRFHRRFAGNVFTNCDQLEVAIVPDAASSGVMVTLGNSTTQTVSFVITDSNQPSNRWSFTVPAGTTTTNVPLTISNYTGAYNLTASANIDSSFLRGFADELGSAAPAAAPRLASTIQGGNFILNYPAWASAWTLETRADISSGSWSSLSANPATNGDNVVVTIPLTPGASYFRLRK